MALDMTLFVCMWLIVFSCGAVIFGFPAVAAALRERGVFANLCAADEAIPCEAQTLAFEDIYINAVSALFVSFGGAGIVMDSYGPKVTSTIGLALFLLGSILMALSQWTAGLVIVGIGGPPTYLSTFHWASIFQKMPHVWTGILVSGMVSSSLVYMAFGELIRAGIEPSTLFYTHAIWVAGCFAFCLVVQPSKCFSPGVRLTGLGVNQQYCCWHREGYFPLLFAISYPELNVDIEQIEIGLADEVGSIGDKIPAGNATSSHHVYQRQGEKEEEEQEEEDQEEGGQEEEAENEVDHEPKHGCLDKGPEGNGEKDKTRTPLKQHSSVRQGAHWESIWDALLSKEHAAINAYLSINILRFNYYIATSLQRIDAVGGGATFVLILYLALPFACVLTPIITHTSLNFGVEATMRYCNWLGLAYGICACVPGRVAQLLTFVLVSAQRMYLFSCLYPFVMCIFGSNLFGRVSGIVLLSAGILSLVQYALISISESVGMLPVDICVFILPSFAMALLTEVRFSFHENSPPPIFYHLST
jgi:hypothetical protein